MNPDDRAHIYESLWSPSNPTPYDEAREAEVSKRRFGPAFPYIQARAKLAHEEDRRLRVLDFGCADGFTAGRILAPIVDQVDYLGSDLYALDSTARRMSDLGFRTQVSVGGASNLPSQWFDLDVVMALSCFQYIPDIPGTFSELTSRLAPGGIFIGYFYDAAPLRRVSDAYFREVFGASGSGIDGLDSLARLCASLREATRGCEITIDEEVPELGIPAGTVPLQQFLIDYVAFTWAPSGANILRIKWALAELLRTGPHTYIGAADIDHLLGENRLTLLERVSGPSGHLVVAQRA